MKLKNITERQTAERTSVRWKKESERGRNETQAKKEQHTYRVREEKS